MGIVKTGMNERLTLTLKVHKRYNYGLFVSEIWSHVEHY